MISHDKETYLSLLTGAVKEGPEQCVREGLLEWPEDRASQTGEWHEPSGRHHGECKVRNAWMTRSAKWAIKNQLESWDMLDGWAGEMGHAEAVMVAA